MGHSGVDVRDQIQVLFQRFEREATYQCFDRFMHIEVDRLDIHFARFDLREIEDVVDHRQ